MTDIVDLSTRRQPSNPGNGAREAVVAWANSPGFAEIHNGGATPEAITDNMLAYLWLAGFKIVPVAEGERF